MGERVGRVEHVLLELRGERRQLEHHGLEALLLRAGQRDAGEAEIEQRMLEHGALLGVELRAVALGTAT